MKRVRSDREFDMWVAVHEITCNFTKLNYGLIMSHKTRVGEDGCSMTTAGIEIKETQIVGSWINPGSTLMKTFISVGIYINPN